eukprot:2743420-Pleurochrysis_carterae.AAC.1
MTAGRRAPRHTHGHRSARWTRTAPSAARAAAPRGATQAEREARSRAARPRGWARCLWSSRGRAWPTACLRARCGYAAPRPWRWTSSRGAPTMTCCGRR